uniref:Uncharacterized protein n=1 Tax=Peronospora matthiolae TaxID=2874970 RepID=A0AAV1T819_9STRA
MHRSRGSTSALSITVLATVPAPDPMTGPNTMARQLKIQLSSLNLEQPKRLCVGLEVAGLHRSQRTIDNSRSLYPPSFKPQLSDDGLVLVDLEVMAELQRGVASTSSMVFKRDFKSAITIILAATSRTTMSGRRAALVYSGTVLLMRSSAPDFLRTSACLILAPICSSAWS